MIRKATLVLTVLAIFVSPGGAVQSTVPKSEKTQKREPAKKAEDKSASMTGCIDEQN
jgi:hypothetical protein